MTPQFAVLSLLARGWRQEDIADAVGVTQPTIHRIKGGVMPAWDTGMKLIEVCKLEKAKRKQPQVAAGGS
jgi:DNA-binding XRE family transcriptional regulator